MTNGEIAFFVFVLITLFLSEKVTDWQTDSMNKRINIIEWKLHIKDAK